MLIAWAPHTKLAGVDPSKGPSDWRQPPGSPENTRGVVPGYQVAHVTRAFTDRHATEAYFVPYIVRLDGRPIMNQPRVNKDGLPWLREQGYEVTVEGAVIDIDRPNHEPWSTPEEARLAVHQAKAKIPTALVYATRGGLRITQPWARSLLPEESEGATAALLRQLETVGLVGDRNCLDWTHGFRLPHVARAGFATVDAAAIVLTFEPLAPPHAIAVTRRTRSKGAPAGPIAWSTELPPHLVAAVDPVARALYGVAGPDPGWHKAHLAIAGALAMAGVDPGHLPSFAHAVAIATRDSRAEDRVIGARTTAQRYASGSEIAGRRWLEVHAPGLAQVIGSMFQSARRKLPIAVRRAPPAPTTLPEVARLQIEAAVRGASEQLTLVVVPCGTGKTRALEVIAIERAGKPQREGAKRSPLGSRTCISVPTHELAIQIQAHLRAVGIECARLIGIASHTTEGKPTCAYVDQAAAIASGGLSVRRELCDGRGRPCEHRESCAARDGIDGDESARVVVGPHALVSQLDEMAGKTGLLAIDEPPELLRNERITLADLSHAIDELGRFSDRYAVGVRPALLAARAWLAAGVEAPPGKLARAWAAGADAGALDAAFELSGATSVEEAASAAVEDNAKGDRPPLTAVAAYFARTSIGSARSIARAARVAADVREAVIRPEASIATLERPPRGELVLVLTLVTEGLRRAVRREGAIVVLAADADLHAPMLGRAADPQHAPRLVQIEARQGCPARRVLIEAPANRSRWIRRDRVETESVLVALRAAVEEVAKAEPRRTLVVSWMAVEEVLRSHPEATSLLARVGGELAHYGALRGLDRWKDADACITLGDPRPNMGDVAREVAILREGDVGERMAALAAAELEQAFGRLRLIHRTAPATLVHVGEVMPRGWYEPVEIRPLERRGGIPPDELRQAVERAGGTSAAARSLGVDAACARRWLNGARAPPRDVLARLLSAPRGASNDHM